MLMNRSGLYKGVLSLMFLAVSVWGVAQQQQQEQQHQEQQQQEEQLQERRTTIDSIDVIRDYRPILADAVKIRRSPDMTNKREYQPTLTYTIIDKKLDITTGTRRLDIQQLPATTLLERNNNYVKIGGGNFSTLLGEVYLANDEYLDTRFGAYARHLSQRGDVAGQLFSEQEVTVFGRQLHEAFTISGDLGYKRYATQFYGLVFDEMGGSLNPEPDRKQAFNDVFLDAELVSRHSATVQNPLTFSLKATGYLYSDANEASENSFALSGYLDKQVNAFYIGAHAAGDFNRVKSGQTSLSNHLVRVNPYIRFKGENYDLKVGANLVSEFGDSTRSNIFPNVALEFALAPGYAHLFAGVNGDVQRTSFRDLSRENPWLMENIGISNVLERYNIYGGIKGNAGATFGYQVSVSYRRLENMHFFRNNLLTPYRFDVVYEDGEKASGVFGFEGALNFRVSETVTLGGKLNFNEYELQTEEEAWHLPKLQIGADTRVNISDRLYLNGELLLMGQTYSQVLDHAEAVKVTIPAFVDLSAGLEFRATSQIGVFGRVNNLLGNGYERYLYYPRLGLNVIGGVSFTF